MSPNDHLVSFQKKVRKTRFLLARQIKLTTEQKVPKTELEAIYELCFMNVFVAFENDLTELLKTNLLMKHGGDGKLRSLYNPNSRPAAEKLLLGTNRYFQLLPVEQMEKVARVYLKNGGPFVTLTSSQKNELGKAAAIRNHIAHKSAESKKTYKKKILSHVILPKSSFSPGYYLKSNLSHHRTYFDHHVAEIGSCLRDIVSNS
jgi:hypothetical protein